MKNLIASFTSACFMLTLGLGALLTLSMSGCEKDPIVPPPVYGCTDSQAENYDPVATVNDGSCSYTHDKIPGAYFVISMECSAHYEGYLSGVESISITPYLQQPGLVTVSFPDRPVALFGTGWLSGNSLRVLNTRLTSDAEYIELNATLQGNILKGQFVITNADQTNGGSKENANCSFVASK